MIRRAHQALFVAAIAVSFAACSDDPQGPNAADVDKTLDDKIGALPKPVPSAKVETFAVTPSVITRGEKAKLTYRVTNATDVVIRDADMKGVAGVDSASLEGTVEISPTVTTDYLLQAHGDGGNDFALLQLVVKEPDAPIVPAPLLFTAVPTVVDAGQAAYLVWSAPEPVLVTDDANVELSATSKSGSLAVQPLKDTVYTAFANSTPAQTVKVTVKVNAAIQRFTSDKAAAAPGEKLVLSWKTAGATDVSLSERAAGPVHTATAAERDAGSFEVTLPTVPEGTALRYTLTAKNANATRTADLTVLATRLPSITTFTGPSIVSRGVATKPALTWTTTNAKGVSIYSGAKGMTPARLEYVAPSSAVASGTVSLSIPNADTDYLLVATSEQGGTASKLFSMKVVAPPAITSFTADGQATGTTVANGGDSATLAWTTTDGTLLSVAAVGGSVIYATRLPADMASKSVVARPGSTTEYLLTVTNEAGDQATKKVTVTVTNPLGFGFSPAIANAGESVALSWDFSAVSGAVFVIGAPAGQTAPAPGGASVDDFIELDGDATATELSTLTGSTSTGTAEAFTFPNGFKFRHFGKPYDNAAACSNGWVSFDSTATTCSTKPSTTIPSTSTPNNWVGPWAMDNLVGGKVLYKLEGIAPERRLIVEWSGWKKSGATTGNITFELVLGETGKVDFLYKSMTSNGCGTSSSCSSIVIGMENADGTEGYKASYTAAPAGVPTGATKGDKITFNGELPVSSAQLANPPKVKAVAGAVYNLNLATPAGLIGVSGTPKVLNVGDLAISEVMYKPVAAPAGAKGQWVELQNRSTFDLDLSNVLLTVGAGTPVALSGTLAAGKLAVVGQSKLTAENGDTPVDLELAALSLTAAADTVKIAYKATTTVTMASVSWVDSAAVTAGTALEAGDPRYRTATGPALCPSTTTYGNAGSRGSPGTATTTCSGPYRISTATPRFIDISTTGTKVVTKDYYCLKKVTFPSGFTFPHEGVSQTAVMMGSGYLNFDTTQSDTTSNSYKDNPTSFPPTSATSVPQKGTIAVFWDADGSTSNANNAYLFKAFINPDGDASTADSYLVFQWAAMDLSGQSPDSDLNYEAILYENGNIEFQYGTMTPGGYGADRAAGSSASIGLMNADNTKALVIGHNQAVVQPNTGVLFTKI